LVLQKRKAISKKDLPVADGDSREAIEVIGEIQETLRILARSGWRGFDCSQSHLQMLDRWGTPPKDAPETLEDIRRDLGDCRRCKLKAGRTHIVFGEGDPGARLVFVGEGPGFEEDQQGRPFVGAAGQLLTKIIAAIGLDREQVYICNIIKCRPPGNRNPETDEIEACAPFVRRQLRAISPEFVCTLGTFATRTLLQTDKPISRLRGRFHEMAEGIRVLPTYHPAYLLRNPERKRDVWEDMKLLMQAMGLPLAEKPNRRS
jgi:DNA polymerase